METCPNAHDNLIHSSKCGTRPRDTYLPTTIKDFSNSIYTCKAGYYKTGSKCKEDCSYYSLVACGAACAATTATCALIIAEMVINVAFGILSIIIFILSFGTGAKPAEEGIHASEEAAEDALKGVSNVVKAEKVIGKKSVWNRFFKKVTDDMIKIGAKAGFEYTCGAIAQQYLTNMAQPNSASQDLTALGEDMDFLGISGVVGGCGADQRLATNQISCASSVLNLIGNLDPTGVLGALTGIATAFLYPSCVDTLAT